MVLVNVVGQGFIGEDGEKVWEILGLRQTMNGHDKGPNGHTEALTTKGHDKEINGQSEALTPNGHHEGKGSLAMATTNGT